MTLLKYNRYGINYAQVWFYCHEDIGLLKISNVDIIEFKESLVSISESLYPFRNGVIDLTQTLGEIQQGFDKGFSYEIRRAEKEKITCHNLTNVDSKKLEQIYQVYKFFCINKQIDIISFKVFFLYLNSNSLRISVAIQENILLQYHIYFVGEFEVILLASFPGDKVNQIKNSTIGYANRYLHWFDIQQACKEGKKTYNLGGIGNSNDSGTNGIVKFKMEMGPNTQVYYQGLIYTSIKGKVYSTIKKLLKKHA